MRSLYDRNGQPQFTAIAWGQRLRPPGQPPSLPLGVAELRERPRSAPMHAQVADIRAIHGRPAVRGDHD